MDAKVFQLKQETDEFSFLNTTKPQAPGIRASA